jgi:hypothetical protein
VNLSLKTLIWWSLLEKREPYRDKFIYEKSIKTDIFALITVFSFKKIEFLSLGIALFSKTLRFSR